MNFVTNYFCCYYCWITKGKRKGSCVHTEWKQHTCGTVTETTTTHWQNNQHLEDEISVAHTTYNNGKVLKQQWLQQLQQYPWTERWQMMAAWTVEDLGLAETPKKGKQGTLAKTCNGFSHNMARQQLLYINKTHDFG